VPVNGFGAGKHVIPKAVDNYHENNMMTATLYGLEGTASSVFLGGMLHADYGDVNSDGHTDIVLSGIRQIFQSDGHGEQILAKEFYVKEIYMYDPPSDTFLRAEDLGENMLIFERAIPGETGGQGL